jgi:amino acid transporter
VVRKLGLPLILNFVADGNPKPDRAGIIRTIFSYTGMEIFAATAAESKSLGNAESMKMAARKIALRVVTLSCFAMFTASLLVPYNHPYINGNAPSVGARSVFVIAVVEAGLPKLAHFFNAMFVLSAFSCAINFLYLSSRILYTLALLEETGPNWITERLKQCHSGVPTRAVFVSALLTLLGYMGRTGSPGEV